MFAQFHCWSQKAPPAAHKLLFFKSVARIQASVKMKSPLHCLPAAVQHRHVQLIVLHCSIHMHSIVFNLSVSWMFSHKWEHNLLVSCKGGIFPDPSETISCSRVAFVCWALRSQSCHRTSEFLPADTSGFAQWINTVCLMFSYSLINIHQNNLGMTGQDC